MGKQYEQIELEILFYTTDVISTSGDGYVEDPWGEGNFGGLQ